MPITDLSSIQFRQDIDPAISLTYLQADILQGYYGYIWSEVLDADTVNG